MAVTLTVNAFECPTCHMVVWSTDSATSGEHGCTFKGGSTGFTPLIPVGMFTFKGV